MTIELFQFQQSAATQIADRFFDYVNDPIPFGRKNERRNVPFYQALSSITGSGKTAILAEAVSQIIAMMDIPPVVLWLSKGKVVVQQSFANLAGGGKYSHLLDDVTVRLLSEYDPADVANAKEALLYFATVGTFNQRDRENSNLRMFALDTDRIESTPWEALKQRLTAENVRRPLLVVYDEAQNLSDQQTTLLLEQQPAAFLLASATLTFPSRFNDEVIQPLRTQGGYVDEDLITAVPSSVVVESGLVKGIISLDGLNTPMQETISEMLSDMHDAEAAVAAEGLSFKPKAIYVCNTNMTADDAALRDNPKQPFEHRQAPPILIWRYLVDECGIDPREVAVYADLATHKEFALPDEFVLFGGGESDYDDFVQGNFRHIIFNQTLQEGWDDPEVYFAYVDKTMESKVQITQIVGRVLRQPGAKHYSADRLNTAHFYVRVDRNDTFAGVVDEVRKGLGGEGPTMRILTSPPGSEALDPIPVKEERLIPQTAISTGESVRPVQRVLELIHDYSTDTLNTRGAGRRRHVQQTVGSNETADSEWSDFEQSGMVSARWVFRREVSRRYRKAESVMNTGDAKFDAKIGVGSPAYSAIAEGAKDAVDEFLRHSIVKVSSRNPHPVGASFARRSGMIRFNNALHEGYDQLNPLEESFAFALDDTGLTWARNRSQTGYRIPLISLGQTEWFYPDFIVWAGDDILCVDTKGHHLVEADARRKLLAIEPHRNVTTQVRVKFVVEGTWKPDWTPDSKDGYSILELGSGRDLRALPFESMEELAKSLTEIDAGDD